VLVQDSADGTPDLPVKTEIVTTVVVPHALTVTPTSFLRRSVTQESQTMLISVTLLVCPMLDMKDVTLLPTMVQDANNATGMLATSALKMANAPWPK
jgi:hypothetical protein